MSPDTHSPIPPLDPYYGIRRDTDTELAYQHLDLAPKPDVPDIAWKVLAGGIVLFFVVAAWGFSQWAL